VRRANVRTPCRASQYRTSHVSADSDSQREGLYAHLVEPLTSLVVRVRSRSLTAAKSFAWKRMGQLCAQMHPGQQAEGVGVVPRPPYSEMSGATADRFIVERAACQDWVLCG